MKIRLSIALIVLSLLMSLVGGVMAQDGNLVEVAAANPDFSTLVSLVEAAGLTETLSGEGPFTVFAPTNDAFAALPPAVLAYLGANPEALTAVLTYHVIAGQVSSDMVSTMGAATVQGGEIAVVADEAGVTVDGVAVTAVDVLASNGVIHVIDEVLIPNFDLPAVDPLDYSDGSIVMAGSSTVFPLVERMGELWEEAGGIAPSIDSIGSGAGIERFCVAGETDIANSSRAIKTEEIETCGAIGRTPIEFRVGTDALAVVVSSANDFVSDVSSEELVALFSTAVNWSDVRAEWPAEPIQRFIPGTDSGTFDYFVEILFAKDEAPILATNPQTSEDDNVLVTGIQASPYAIGFFGYAYYQENADTLKTISVDSVAPSFDTAEDGTYILSRPLFLYSDAQILADKPEVAAFINFTLAGVNEEIGDVGYFPAAERNLRLSRLALWASGIYAGM